MLAIRTATGAIGPAGALTFSVSLPTKIDARQFNRAFPKTFPRFVQSAIWRYCAENGLGICNGNRIADDEPVRQRPLPAVSAL